MKATRKSEYCSFCNEAIDFGNEAFFTTDDNSLPFFGGNAHSHCFFGWEGSAEYLDKWYYGHLRLRDEDPDYDVLYYADDIAFVSYQGMELELLVKRSWLKLDFKQEEWLGELEWNLHQHQFNRYPRAERFHTLKVLAFAGERYDEIRALQIGQMALNIVVNTLQSHSPNLTDVELAALVTSAISQALEANFVLSFVLLHAFRSVMPEASDEWKHLREDFRKIQDRLQALLYELLSQAGDIKTLETLLNQLLLPSTPTFEQAVVDTMVTAEAMSM